MATNKTLAPTGVTVQIPAMTDPPSMAVPANAIDKTIDAVNALNSQLVKDLGSKSLSDLETELVTLGNSLGTGGVAHFTVAISATSSPFSAASYIGFIEKITANRLIVTLSRNVVNQTICGRYNGSWTWDEYALNSKLTSQYGNIITDVQYEVCANVVTVYFNGVTVADASAWTKIADLPSGLNTRYSAHFKAMTGQEIQIAGSVINYRGSAGYIFGACTYVRG